VVADELMIVIGEPFKVTFTFCDVKPAPNGVLKVIGLQGLPGVVLVTSGVEQRDGSATPAPV